MFEGMQRPGHSSAHQIFELLANRVSRWELPAGERLTEGRLSAEFGVSRTPVREALRLLEKAGYVEQVPPRGYAVRAVDLVTIDQVYTVRAALEELSVELAAQETSTAAFTALVERARRAAVSVPGEPPGEEMREDFHEELAALSGNAELLRLLRDIDSRIYAYRRLDAWVPDRASGAQAEHLQIVELLRAGQTAQARAAMRQHVERSRETVRSLIRAGVTTISFAAGNDAVGGPA
jgi:DNA-binding GntR family transcriptional regulator